MVEVEAEAEEAEATVGCEMVGVLDAVAEVKALVDKARDTVEEEDEEAASLRVVEAASALSFVVKAPDAMDEVKALATSL